MSICEHVDMPDTALQVVAVRHGMVAVHCPCCNLSGYVEPEDHDPNPCPYCAVDAVRDAVLS